MPNSSSTKDMNMPHPSVRIAPCSSSDANSLSLSHAPFFCFSQISLYITIFGAAFLLFSLTTAITILCAFSSSSSLARLFLNCILPLPAGPFFYLHPLDTLLHGNCLSDCIMSKALGTTHGHWALHLLYQTIFIACAVLCAPPLLKYP